MRQCVFCNTKVGVKSIADGPPVKGERGICIKCMRSLKNWMRQY